MRLVSIALLCIYATCLGAVEEAKKTICLNMIVKNEKSVITRCLASVKPIIDYWIIVDTGSSDGTQDVIREFMKDVPGELHERPWKNFEHNRNEALELVRGKADYALIMDADDILEFDPNFRLPRMDSGSYRMWIKYGGTSYQRHHIVNIGLPWRWIGVLHEVLFCDVPCTSEVIGGVKIVVGTDGARSKDPKKYEKDAAVLEEALKNEPDNSRYMFYLAQSYRDAGIYDKSIDWYAKRIAKGGWDEEVYWSMVQIGILQRELKKPEPEIVYTFLKAHHKRPHRPEAVLNLSELFRKQGRYDLSYSIVSLWQVMPRPVETDVLFIQPWIEEWGMAFEVSISSYYMGLFQESLAACNYLLSVPDLPQNVREKVVVTHRCALQKVEEQKALQTMIAIVEPSVHDESVLLAK